MRETKEERERRFEELRLGIVGDERLAHIAEYPEEACDQDVEVIARELLSARRLLHAEGDLPVTGRKITPATTLEAMLAREAQDKASRLARIRRPDNGMRRVVRVVRSLKSGEARVELICGHYRTVMYGHLGALIQCSSCLARGVKKPKLKSAK